ncbi:hypothetical protein CEXT_763011 [Caerostris extrusa]|uniref:Uncharacterized protein n=1 Tax=Caerostris extrusa TaxID=172846 RepID=A0AAV4XU52_CAEEX|nr:hypothetical protein CEXT_763011 [Caerostris extrusa]
MTSDETPESSILEEGVSFSACIVLELMCLLPNLIKKISDKLILTEERDTAFLLPIDKLRSIYPALGISNLFISDVKEAEMYII